MYKGNDIAFLFSHIFFLFTVLFRELLRRGAYTIDEYAAIIIIQQYNMFIYILISYSSLYAQRVIIHYIFCDDPHAVAGPIRTSAEPRTLLK